MPHLTVSTVAERAPKASEITEKAQKAVFPQKKPIVENRHSSSQREGDLHAGAATLCGMSVSSRRLFHSTLIVFARG